MKGRDHSDDTGIDGRTVLKWILGEIGCGCGVNSYGLGQEPVLSSCEHDSEPSCFAKGRNFMTGLMHYSKPSSHMDMCLLKVAHLVDSQWMKSVLYDISGGTGTWLWESKVNNEVINML
jgi:hypothetical protein